jgi:outer membrane biogenesis lipoprotein LolB
MKLPLLLTAMLLLSACASTTTSGTDAICSITKPKLSASDTDETLISVDNYLAKIRAVCT